MLTELPEIEEDDFAGSPFGPNLIFPDRHSFEEIQIYPLQEKLIIAA
jgi:hypothetical protein